MAADVPWPLFGILNGDRNENRPIVLLLLLERIGRKRYLDAAVDDHLAYGVFEGYNRGGANYWWNRWGRADGRFSTFNSFSFFAKHDALPLTPFVLPTSNSRIAKKRQWRIE